MWRKRSFHGTLELKARNWNTPKLSSSDQLQFLLLRISISYKQKENKCPASSEKNTIHENYGQKKITMSRLTELPQSTSLVLSHTLWYPILWRYLLDHDSVRSRVVFSVGVYHNLRPRVVHLECLSLRARH